jgi:hypothetical protein
VEQKLDDDVTIGDIADAMYEIVEGEHGRPLPPAELFERLKERYAGVSVASFFRAPFGIVPLPTPAMIAAITATSTRRRSSRSCRPR